MVTHTEVLAQFQAANMAVFTAICRTLIDSGSVETQLLLSHLEKLSSAAMASDLSPGAQSVIIDQLLVDMKAYAALRDQSGAANGLPEVRD